MYVCSALSAEYTHPSGTVANPARGQLNRSISFSLSPFVPENLVCRDGFGRPVPRPACSFSTFKLNQVLTHGIPPAFHVNIKNIPSTAIGSVPSLSGHPIAYRWRSLPRVRRHLSCSPQGSSSNGWLPFQTSP